MDENPSIENEKDDEISLIDLFAVLLKHKLLIILVTGIAMIGVVLASIISLKLPPEKSFLPNEYTPQAEMLINDSSSASGGLSAALNASGLGSLAGLAGISAGGGSSNSALAEYLINSNTILDAIVDQFGLIEKWEIEKSPRAASRDALKKALVSDYDSSTGIFTIKFSDIDPAFACDVINFTVDILEKRFNELGIDKNKLEEQNLKENIQTAYDNIVSLQKQTQRLEQSVSNIYNPNSAPSVMLDSALLKMELSAQEQIYGQLKVQYETLKVSMASEKPVFQIVEYAEIPDRKSGPSRGKLCIIVTFAAFFISVFLAFAINAVENIKKDPEAMAKLKASKK